MDGMEIALQYGPLGIFAAYMIRKESLWEAEKKALTTKYENLMTEAIREASDMKSALKELKEEIQQLKGSVVK